MLEIIQYTLPSLIVLAAVYFVARAMLQYAGQKTQAEVKLKETEISLPIRLQAYERVSLLLERIAPESLLIRVNKPGMTALQLQAELMAAIRAEFEHNLSQQIYMSDKAWDLVRNARNQVTLIINKTAISNNAQTTSTELSKKIIDSLSELTKSPVQDALDFIKNEARQLF